MTGKDSGTNLNPDDLDGLDSDQLTALLNELQPQLNIFNPDETLKRQISRLQSHLAKYQNSEKQTKRQSWYTV